MFWQDYPKTYPIVILIVGLFVFKFFTLLVYKRRNNISSKDNFIIGVNSIYYIFLSILFILLIMVLLKVNIREFFTSISIIAAAIAILSKDYISNAINGMILMFNNQISIDDYIKIGQHKGRIVHISLINVHLLNEEHDLIYIPNTSILSHDVINYSKGYNELTSVDVKVLTANIVSLEDLQKQLSHHLSSNENVVPNSLKIKVIDIKRKHIHLKAEVKLIQKSTAIEIEFKKSFLDAWLKSIKSAV